MEIYLFTVVWNTKYHNGEKIDRKNSANAAQNNTPPHVVKSYWKRN